MKYSAFLLFSCLILSACSGSGGGADDAATSGGGAPTVSTPAPTATPTPTPTSSGASGQIKLNQLGFTPSSTKIALVPNVDSTEFIVVKTSDDSVVMTGSLSAAGLWAPAGESVKYADFTSLNVAGEYKIRVTGAESDSVVFAIEQDIYSDVHDAALKAYYFNRASSALLPEYAGQWAREAGHPDDAVVVAANAATQERPAGTVLSAPKGWYDAGDYNKYIVNSGISVYTLLAAYEHFSDFYASRDVNIPESGDAVPDILDEVMWNLDWMEAMQDTDGGVYHKLTHESFSGRVMPVDATAPRYVVQKGTAATLDFAAVMAVASRIYANFETAFPGKADAYRLAAIEAYQWAKANPNVAYEQTFSKTGAYGDSTFGDEFAWASAELFILTEQTAYLDDFYAQGLSASVPYWGGVGGLAFVSLAQHGKSLLTAQQYSGIINSLTALGDTLVATQSGNAFFAPMSANDFVWGSNSAALNNGVFAYQAYRFTGEEKYREVALASADYVLGRNAANISFVTGFGTRSSMNIHHRPSDADNVSAPVPGFLAGGPHSGRQDGCEGYLGVEPAKSYLDDWCSYSTNEITINWNAPLVYVLAALQSPRVNL